MEILNVRTKNAKVKPGDKVAIDVTMKPYRGEEFTKTVYFKVPKDHRRQHFLRRLGADKASHQ